MGRLTRPRTVAGVVTALATALALPGAATGAEPAPADQQRGVQQTAVFESGTHGYDTFRIPAITRAEDGTLLAFAEGRVGGGGDTGDIDLVLRRSSDNGRTWGPLQVVGDNGANVFGNPTPIVDPASGDIVLLTTHNAGTASEAEIMRGEVTDEESRRVFVQRSTDEGETWSEPTDITADAKLPQWRWYATGPVHGIALEHGPHAGRLVAPANHSTSPPPGSGDTGRESKYYGAHSLYSDDGGRTWQIGGIDTPRNGVLNPNESTVLELSDGTLYFNTRDQNGTSSGTRAATTSSDGGESFDAPYEMVDGLSAPVVQGSVLKLSPRADRHERIVFSAPADPGARRELTLRTSFDQAQSWESSLVLHEGPAAYSDLVETSSHALGVLYENGDDSAYERITFASVRIPMLDRPDQGEPPAVITPDVSGSGRHGVVGGAAEVTSGASGSALTLAEGAYVEVPASDGLGVGDGPFTAAAWFRTESGAAQSVLWAYGVGGGVPQWWIRAEPGSDRIRALIETDAGVTSVAAPGAYADGEWHHVALTRGADGVTLYVDGEAAATAGPLGGAVSSETSTGLHVGRRPDGANALTGAVDDVWYLGRALSPAEVAALAADDAAPSGRALVHLPLDELRRDVPAGPREQS
ncbi:sialidase-1 [Haloactinopolyspora alba]|uniref:exo-alpha-sialidase n=1 Tax=Haloactinopolyspora alba TaxID=648780 RepID=A0A2P8E1B5_9ACTN|nr:sialidase family protein [Haloactinopolyspora alba]PSL03261.1 sialidase-1 [Haloactinopolyspora alba]